MKKEICEDYSEAFAKYYDILTHDKDYALETKILNELIDSLRIDQSSPLIDVGCGTGSHSIKLSQLRKNPISAFDISQPMLTEAIAKRSRVKFFSGSLLDVEDSAYSFAYSLYNVVNCITELADLLNFFVRVNRRLKIGGYYFFEFWNRAAVLEEPPVIVTKVVNFGPNKLIRIAEPDNSYLSDGILNLVYKIEITDVNEDLSQFQSLHRLRLYDLEDLQHSLSAAGFEINFRRGALPNLTENIENERMLSMLVKKTGESLS
tara:strand:+ start:2948 stop:3733 length:786 start_codon:yes stop_codon:yes gene_type:complete